MDKDNVKWRLNENKIDSLMMLIIVLIYLLESFTNSIIALHVFILICTIYSFLGIILPGREYFRRDCLKDRKVTLMFFIRRIPDVVLLVCGYEILLSKNYSLKYTYWIGAVLTIYLMLKLASHSIIEGYKEDKSNNRKHFWLFRTGAAVLWFLFLGFQFHIIMRPIIQPQHEIVLDNLKVPERIMIYKYENNKTHSMSPFTPPISEISSPEHQEKIIKALRDTRVENITLTDLINHYRMRNDNSPYYILELEYSRSSTSRKLEDGYVESIMITSNKQVVIKQSATREVLFGTKRYYEIYPVDISEDIMDMIFKYIDFKGGQ